MPSDSGGEETMLKLLIVADDLTGALDTGVQLARLGADTRVRFYTGPGTVRGGGSTGTLVVDTESRHLPPTRAAEIVEELVREALEAGAAFVYKKTDSALRGNLGPELMAAARAAGVRPVPFLPAWPENGRTTLAGVHYVNDVPLAETDFAADVLNPITSSRVVEILSAQERLDVRTVAAGETDWPQDGDILAFDAQTGEHVDAVAELLYRRGMLRLTAGCARLLQGLSPWLLPLLPRRSGERIEELGTVLLACGSLSPASLKQTRYAVSHLGYRLVTPDGEPGAPGSAEIPAGGRLALRSSQAENLEDVRKYLEGVPQALREETARQTALAMGARISEIVTRAQVQTLIIFGGDTLAATVRQLGITALEPVTELARGVVLCRTVCGGRPLNLVTKAGSFGDVDLVESIESSWAVLHGNKYFKND